MHGISEFAKRRCHHGRFESLFRIRGSARAFLRGGGTFPAMFGRRGYDESVACLMKAYFGLTAGLAAARWPSTTDGGALPKPTVA